MRTAYLTAEQFVDFHARHRRLLLAISAALLYFGGVVLIGKSFPLKPYGFAITVGGFLVCIFGLYCMFRYHCPVCKKTPRARMWSFGGGEIVYSKMVALFPKTCSECGVHFRVEKDYPPSV